MQQNTPLGGGTGTKKQKKKKINKQADGDDVREITAYRTWFRENQFAQFLGFSRGFEREIISNFLLTTVT